MSVNICLHGLVVSGAASNVMLPRLMPSTHCPMKPRSVPTVPYGLSIEG